MNLIMKGIHTALEPLSYQRTSSEHDPVSHVGFAGVPHLLQRFNHRRRVNRAIRELSALNDATLKDIGIERGNIPELVGEMLKSGEKPGRTSKFAPHEHAQTGRPVTGGANA